MQNFKKGWLLTVIFMSLVLAANSFAQYSKWEIEAAIKYLQKRQVLDNLIRLTQEDQAKLTSRPDVLIACYEILREVENMNTRINQKVAHIESLINQLESDTLSAKANYTTVEKALINRTLNEVEENLDNFSGIIKLKKDVETLDVKLDSTQVKIESIDKRINTVSSDKKKIEKLEKGVKRSKLVSYISAGVAFVAALICAWETIVYKFFE